MDKKILNILETVLPKDTMIIVKPWKAFYGGNFLKIGFAVSDFQIHGVKEQYVQYVSLLLDLDTMELNPQIFGGMGGQCIYRKIDKDNPKEIHFAMQRIKIPFRMPKKEEKFVLSAIERFAKNWLKAIQDNKEKMMYQEYVNYDEFLNS